MEIEYKITKYFDDNNLFNNTNSNGLKVKIDNKSLVITGNSRNLVELADVLVSMAKCKDNTHVHLDDLTLVDKKSDISEIIIEKSDNYES